MKKHKTNLSGYCVVYVLNNCFSAVETNGSFHSINLSVYSFAAKRGNSLFGIGYDFEVCGNQVFLRARNFVLFAGCLNLTIPSPLYKRAMISPDRKSR